MKDGKCCERRERIGKRDTERGKIEKIRREESIEIETELVVLSSSPLTLVDHSERAVY